MFQQKHFLQLSNSASKKRFGKKQRNQPLCWSIMIHSGTKAERAAYLEQKLSLYSSREEAEKYSFVLFSSTVKYITNTSWKYLRWGKLDIHCWHSSSRPSTYMLVFCSYKSSSIYLNICCTCRVAALSNSWTEIREEIKMGNKITSLGDYMD